MAIIEQILESFQTFSVTLGCFLAKLPPSNSHSKLPKYNASTYTHFLHSSYHPQQKPHLHFAQVSIFQCHMGHIHSHFNNCLIFNILHLPTKQSITMCNKQTLHIIQSLLGHTFKTHIDRIFIHKTCKSFWTYSVTCQK